MKYKILSFLSVFVFYIFLFLLTGCSDATQLNQKLVIQGIGIDTENNNYKVTLQALDFQNLEEENTPSIRLIELYGKTLSESLESIYRKTGLTPLYSQNLIVVIGNEVASKGVNNFIDFFIRHYEARPNVKICVSNSTASDIMSFELDEKIMSAKSIHDLIPKDINSDILHFVSNLRNKTSDPFCAALSIMTNGGRKSINMCGIGIFSDDKLLEIIKEDDYIGTLLTMGVGNIGTYNIDIEDIGNLSIGINKVSTTIYSNINDRKEFNINVYVSSILLEVDRKSWTKIGIDEQKKIKEQLAVNLESISTNAVNKIINLRCDIFNFGKILLKCDPNYLKSIQDTWKESIMGFTYNININPEISVTGTEI